MKSNSLFFKSEYSLCLFLIGTIILIQAFTFKDYRLMSFDNILTSEVVILIGLLLFSQIARNAGFLLFVGFAAFLLWSIVDGFWNHWSSMNVHGASLIGIAILQLAVGYYLRVSKSFSTEFEEKRANAPSWICFARTTLIAIVVCIVLYAFVHDVLILVTAGK